MIEVVAKLAFSGDRVRIREAFFVQKACDLVGCRLTGINKSNIFADRFLNDSPQDRVVGTAQNQRVGTKFVHLLKVCCSARSGLGLVQPIFLSEWCKQRATRLTNSGRARRSSARAGVRLARDSRLGRAV